MFVFIVEHQPDGTLMRFRGKLVRRPAHDGSTFSGVEPSGKPRAVQFPSPAPSALSDACGRPKDGMNNPLMADLTSRALDAWRILPH
jgi:hypothetical protein